MRKFTITADDGQQLTGQLPEDWHEVPLAPYVALATAAQALPASLGEPTVHPFANPAAIGALAALLGIPAEPLLASPSLLLDLFEAAPWLFVGPLPAGTEAPPTLTHQGVTYAHVGELGHATAAQFEALLILLQAHEAQPLAVAPHLLAILYQPAGRPGTADTTRQAVATFHSLPMHLAWPAVQAFLVRSAPLVLAFQKYGTARLAAGQALRALETAAGAWPSSAPRGFCWSMLRWLVRHWIRRVQKQLTTCLPPSAFTAAPMNSAPNLLPSAKPLFYGK